MAPREYKNKSAHILNVAKKVFAEYGYDGASMDLLSKKAKVNKALIYYHFKSKEEIRNTIINELISETLTFQNKAHESTQLLTADMIEHKRSEFFSFVEKRKEVFSIMLEEISKTNDKNYFFFKFLDARIDDLTTKHHNNIDYKVIANDFMIDFFFNLLPAISFIVLSDKWSKHYKINKKEMIMQFNSVHQIYLNYHSVKKS